MALAISPSLGSVGCGPSRERLIGLESLVRAERLFASLCREQGIKAAFLANLGEEGVVFRPQPVNGLAWYSQSSEKGAELAWEPVFADISSAGDLGYTTGPWSLGDKGAEPNVFGQYVSVWRKKPGDEWKVAIDVGVVHPKPDDWGKRGRQAEYAPEGGASAADSADTKNERRLLREASQRYFQMCGEGGIGDAYREFASDDILVLRSGVFPVGGKKQAIGVIGGEPRISTIEGMGGDLSASADLGYTYGVLRWQDGEGREERAASYLWVWKRGADRSWKLVVDVTVADERPSGREGE